MSRIGKKNIIVPKDVTVSVNKTDVVVKGKLGELKRSIPSCLSLKQEADVITVERVGDEKTERVLHGTLRNNLVNMIIGVSTGYKRNLEINGVGYRAEVKGKNLTILLGRAKPAVYEIPTGITITVEQNTKLSVTGIEKEKVGVAAAIIRGFYPPEPYKGKGIKYDNEVIRRKAGKTVAGK